MTVKGNKHKQQSQNSDELKLVYQMHLRFAVMTFGTFLVCQLMKTQKGEVKYFPNLRTVEKLNFHS